MPKLSANEWKYAAFMAVSLVATAIMGWVVYTDTKECEAMGGKRMRGLFESFQCYDVKSLKVLP